LKPKLDSKFGKDALLQKKAGVSRDQSRDTDNQNQQEQTYDRDSKRTSLLDQWIVQVSYDALKQALLQD
jgi:hypothetical protein